MESKDELESTFGTPNVVYYLSFKRKINKISCPKNWTSLTTRKNNQQTKDSLWLNTFDPIFKIKVDEK
jgi:ribosomal protein L33